MPDLAIRLCEPIDRDAFLKLARSETEEYRPHVDFDEGHARQTFRNALDGKPVLFVLLRDGTPIGFSIVSVGSMGFSRSIFAIQEVLYVRPEYRSAATEERLITVFSIFTRNIGCAEAYIALPGGRGSKARMRDAASAGFMPTATLLRRTERHDHVEGR